MAAHWNGAPMSCQKMIMRMEQRRGRRDKGLRMGKGKGRYRE
jgi:hypothetical protein